MTAVFDADEEESVAAVAGPTRSGLGASAIYTAVSIALLFVVWEVGSAIVGRTVLPGPWASFRAIKLSADDGYLWSDVRITFWRVIGAFVVSLVASVAAGVILGGSKVAGRVFGPWVTITASIPALVFVVVAYLAIGLSDRAAIVGTALVVAPIMTFNVWDGMKALDPELSEMARAFDTHRLVTVWRVLLPQTTPFVFSAARAGLSLAWRIMIFVELIGRSSGVGYRIQYWYTLFNMERVLAAALPFVILMLLLEFGVLRPLERYVFRWRRSEVR